ncbi:MAG TPA: LysR substrate-binding domain-containing protein [Steroidobacteraceae bacterium]|nr:LysR substrate-binding domain-containing protein [Steroidobacteraceae bacterium]
MKIDTLGVQAFIAIAMHRNFRRAAAELHITQTALSRRLQTLEAYLGVKLIERTTRSVELTRTGADFLPRAQRLLTELETSLTDIRETGKAMRGSVTIACVPSIGARYLPHVIQQYSAAYPQNRITIHDHSSFGVAAAVLRREAEFGINVTGSHDAGLASVALARDRFVLICRDDHPLAARRKVSWAQLEPHLLIFPGNASANKPVLELALTAVRLRLRTYYEVQHSSTALGLVAEGVGVAVVPGLAVQKEAYPRIRVLPLVDPAVARSLVLIAPRNAQLSPAARALYDMLVQHARAKGRAGAAPAHSRSAPMAV